MIVYKTFTGQMDKNQDVLPQQQAIRSQLAIFLNETAENSQIIQISELAMPENNLFTATVWYTQPDAKPQWDMSSQPEAQSADVLSRSLHEQERREIVNTMIAEHLIRSDSK